MFFRDIENDRIATFMRDGYVIDPVESRPALDRIRAAIVDASAAFLNLPRPADDARFLETIGDQWSDLLGGHAERAYKLPNPMYYLP